MYNPVNSIVSVVIGVLMIIAWAPTIFLTEINNKGNRLELNKIKNYLKTDNFKVTPGFLTGDIITNINLNELIKIYLNNVNISTDRYIYILYDIYKINITTTNKNEQIITEEKIDTKFNGNVFFKENSGSQTVLSDTNLEYLARQNLLKTHEFATSNQALKMKIVFYGIVNNAKVCKLDDMTKDELSKEEYDLDVYGYEYGENKEQAAQAIIERKDTTNIVWKWLGRLGTFILLCGGLMALISPIRDAVNAGFTIPGIGILFAPVKWLVGLYDVASFIIAIILTVLMTIFVYTLVNYPLISIALGGMIVGLTLYFKKA